jgi:hypothetical protein
MQAARAAANLRGGDSFLHLIYAPEKSWRINGVFCFLIFARLAK